MATIRISCSGASRKSRQKVSKGVTCRHAYIKSTLNNTIVSLTDTTGAAIAWTSSGQVDPRGSRKSILFVVQLTVEAVARRAQEHGTKKVDIFVRGPGSGYKTVIRSLQVVDFEAGLIQNVTPQAHSGARPPKCRRV